MIGLDGVRDESHAELVVGAGPCSAGVVAAELEGLVVLGVGEGFVLALVPAEAAEDTDILSQLLLCIQGKTVLHLAVLLMFRNLRSWVLARKVGVVRDPVEAHVGMVNVAQDTNDAFSIRG